MEKLLLHICCAPCIIYPLERLQDMKFQVIGLFYNPNIQPLEEYLKRRLAVEEFSRKASIEVICPDYHPDDFFSLIGPDHPFPDRCAICWELRLKKTAQTAKELGIFYFSTTLLVSPYQDQELLQGIGWHIEEEENINFYFEDFRTGFRAAHQQAKEQGIYCQKYCGCIYSKEERCRKSAKS